MERKILKVIRYNQLISNELRLSQDKIHSLASSRIIESDLLIEEFKEFLNEEKHLIVQKSTNRLHSKIVEKIKDDDVSSFDEIYRSASERITEEVLYSNIVSKEEFQEIYKDFSLFEKEFEKQYSLDVNDYLLAVLSGVISGLFDVFVSGESSKNIVSSALNCLGLPCDVGNPLGKNAKVSFDMILSSEHGAKGNHRWNSSSHHPTLHGFWSALRDVMNGTSTHVVNRKKICIVNPRFGNGKENSFFQAIKIVLQHWGSDINTKLGLPAPFMDILQRTEHVDNIARQLYSSGYDLRYFLGKSITTFVNEFLVRLFLLLRKTTNGTDIVTALNELREEHLKIEKMLFFAHGITTAFNAGKVYFSKNIMHLNIHQWFAFLNAFIRQMKEALFGCHYRREISLSRAWVDQMRKNIAQIEEIERLILYSDFPILHIS